MALDLTPEQKATGKLNFEQTAAEIARKGQMRSLAVGGDAGPDRRDFLKAGLAAGAVAPVSAAVYYGYDQWRGSKAVRTAFIGVGDEGGVLIGDHNPEFNEVVAVCDIRPSNLDRIFEGEPQGPRKGLKRIYGSDAANQIKKYDNIDSLLADKDKLGLEMVVIATPLNTHDVITKACMDAGLHVLCEKLMARTIPKCKDMIKYAHDKGLLLGIGHQRHYSMLYAHALEVIESGVLGDVKHIRALWHRNNSWPFSASAAEREKYDERYGLPYYKDGWCKPILKQDSAVLTPEKLQSLAFGNVNEYGFSDVAELVRWRLFDKTGGGLMAELGSHQLDAASIILGHVHPLSVQGVGGKFFYGPQRNDRESDDGVWVTYEFPGKNHPKAGRGGTDENDIVVVTYSSFNTNSFENYGECVMGSRGTMIIEQEKDVYLFKEPEPGKANTGGRETKVTVSISKDGKPDLAASSTWGGGGASISKGASAPAWDSAVRGYRTEMEHFAYCIRRWDRQKGWAKTKDGQYEQEVPRCTGEVAMADAIVALTANMAMKTRQRIEFEEAWFDANKPDNPESKYVSRVNRA